MKNISIKDFATQPDVIEIDSILNFLNPKNTFLGKEVNIQSMPYTNVRYCLKLIKTVSEWSNVAELFNICFEVSSEDFWKSSVTEFYAARNHLMFEFKNIIETENKMFAQKHSKDLWKWDLAGVKRLEPYNDTISLDRLGQRYGVYPFDLGRKPYSEVFYLQCLVKTENEINTAFAEIK